MEVNQEREELEALLEVAPKLVEDGGRMAIISFHSLEDRAVKQKFIHLARSGEARLVVKKPVVPSDDEVRSNPASRSAKMRVLEMGSGAKDEIDETDE